MGQQGIVPSNYVEMMAAGPLIPALPQAPPGYAPQADAKSAYPPQQMGMPQQQMGGFGMPQQQQMGGGQFGQQQQQPMGGFGMQSMQAQMGGGGAPSLFKSW